jgi:cellulose biosynthesis protein BcsQ
MAVQKIAIFNHKGGVGKTTLTVNIAHALAKLNKRVLVVDADPQCNISAYYIEADAVDIILDNAEKATGNTLWSAVRPVIDSNSDAMDIRPYRIENNLYLLHGDLKLSNFELELANSWTECFQRKTRGLKATTALSSVVSSVAKRFKIDYVFFDVGPNIGSLNRVVLLDCDYFIVPAACDLFSLRALATLGRTIAGWVADWKVISSIAPASMAILKGHPKFLGYIPQRFRVYRGVATQGHARLIGRIGKGIGSDVVNVLRATDSSLAQSASTDFKLGEVRDFNQCALGSQLEGVPIEEYSKATELQKSQAAHTFDSIAKKIIRLAK